MRTDGERIAAMHKRAEQLEKENKSRNILIVEGVVSAGILALLIWFAAVIPGVSQMTLESGAPGIGNASIFADSPALGYIVIAIVAFLLGTALTLFCVRLRRWKALKNGVPSDTDTKDTK